MLEREKSLRPSADFSPVSVETKAVTGRRRNEYLLSLAPIDREGEQMIDARSLHNWLGVGDRFDQWLKRRCREYGFEEGVDFYPHKCVQINGVKPHHRRKDYALTLDTAKELAMVERTEIGRETRRYFIKMERAALKSMP